MWRSFATHQAVSNLHLRHVVQLGHGAVHLPLCFASNFFRIVASRRSSLGATPLHGCPASARRSERLHGRATEVRCWKHFPPLSGREFCSSSSLRQGHGYAPGTSALFQSAENDYPCSAIGRFQCTTPDSNPSVRAVAQFENKERGFGEK